jgi:hypothetical protein
MIKRILFATSAIALLGAPSALAGENCNFGHTANAAQTAQSDAVLPQSTPVEQTDETTETTVAAATTETQQQ